MKMAANGTESWKVRALTYLEKQLADGHGLSRSVGRMLRDLRKPQPELIVALSGGNTKESLELLKRRLNDYLDGPPGLVVFEHSLACASDPKSRSRARFVLVDGNDVYFAAAANESDEAYGLAASFRTTVFCLHGIGIEGVRRSDGSIDVAAAAEHTIAVYASAYDHEAFIGARFR
jgi:hypothetical protein